MSLPKRRQARMQEKHNVYIHQYFTERQKNNLTIDKFDQIVESNSFVFRFVCNVRNRVKKTDSLGADEQNFG